jgi:predicted dehydrogenase
MVNWIDAIVGAAKVECTLDQSLAVQKIIDAIYQSSKTGREVRISKGRKAG